MKGRKSSGIEEMKKYLKLIQSNDDGGISFLCGSYAVVFEELRGKLAKSELSSGKVEMIKLGRLSAVLDLLFAHLELRQESTKRLDPCDKRSSFNGQDPYVS